MEFRDAVEPKCSCGNCIICDCKRTREVGREQKQVIGREMRRRIEAQIDREEKKSWLRSNHS